MPVFTSSLRPDGGIASGAYGGILQAKLGRNGTYFASSSTSYTDITDMNVTLTPSRQETTFLVLVGFSRASTRQSNLDHTCEFRVVRQIGSGSFEITKTIGDETYNASSDNFLKKAFVIYNPNVTEATYRLDNLTITRTVLVSLNKTLNWFKLSKSVLHY